LAQIFPAWTNKLPTIILIAVIALGAAATGLVWYYFSPSYTDVGYRPVQPVQYSHKWHAGDLALGLDCRYCHTSVEVSSVAIVPPTNTCMNCHKDVLPKSEKLQPVRTSFETGMPVEWTRVHILPDYAYFNHSAHLRAGVGCASCHGSINDMVVVMQAEPLSMGWCLECHRNPDMHLRPASEITNMDWIPAADQAEFAARRIKELNISSPEDCSGCHR